MEKKIKNGFGARILMGIIFGFMGAIFKKDEKKYSF